jgi:hypothetical protein
MAFALRFPARDIPKWAARYSYKGEPELLAGPAVAAKARGYVTAAELCDFGEWKSPRNRARYASNEPVFVEQVTRIALSPNTAPRLAIEVLTLLNGVEWPTASVLLHFCHPDPYPILDFRALWSLSVDVPKAYTYPFWSAYVDYTRGLASRTGYSMRDIDRALWQCSKEREP